MALLLFAAVSLPFLTLLAVLAGGRRLRAHSGWLALVAPVVSSALLVKLALESGSGARTVFEVPWIPSLGLNLSFVVDGLALFFGLVVSGMGALVVFYAIRYLDDHYRHHARFYSYLLLFMGSMLGTVFSANLLLLFVFWELTGVSSFLLIGFLHEKGESRAGARMALLVTSGTALAMLAGLVLVGQVAGTYELAPLLDGALRGKSSGLLNAAFVLIAIGALGKSAQFPFQFWLPNAMAAPTPVSAYLHSATMVKLGVFLVARLFPVFRETELWSPVLVTLCFGTMVLGALLALLSHDLKAILANSTVSQLGFLIGFYGIASPGGADGDLLHITNHVFYKGCLFMVAGIVDHAAGTRDLRELGGLRGRLPLLMVITAIAAATMAGLPGTLGFISKEYMLKEKFDYWEGDAALNWYPIVLVIAASVIKVAFSARIGWGIFGGRTPANVVKHFHRPGLAVQLPPLLLAAGCLVFGLVPDALGAVLHVFQTTGLHTPERMHYSIWHGVTAEFITSALIVAAGLALFALMQLRHWGWVRTPAVLRFDAGFEWAVDALPAAAKGLGRVLRFDRQFEYLAILLGFFVVLLGTAGFVWRDALWPGLPRLEDFHPLRTFVVGLIAATMAMVVVMRQWMAQLIAVSVVGFLITFYYVLFRAPDLAMTQILVESATLLLVLLLLARFPRSAEESEEPHSVSNARQVLNIVISVGVGLLATGLALTAMRDKHPSPAGDFYTENTVPLAKGSNAVNTILVDFRGFDTLLEITVLVIACLGALGLLMRYRRTEEEYAAGPLGPAGYGLAERKKRKRRRSTGSGEETKHP